VARPMPISPMFCWPGTVKALNTRIMMMVSAEMTRPLVAWPVRTAWWLSPVAAHSSRMQEPGNTSL
jgi:hypothetical protein